MGILFANVRKGALALFESPFARDIGNRLIAREARLKGGHPDAKILTGHIRNFMKAGGDVHALASVAGGFITQLLSKIDNLENQIQTQAEIIKRAISEAKGTLNKEFTGITDAVHALAVEYTKLSAQMAGFKSDAEKADGRARLAEERAQRTEAALARLKLTLSGSALLHPSALDPFPQATLKLFDRTTPSTGLAFPDFACGIFDGKIGPNDMVIGRIVSDKGLKIYVATNARARLKSAAQLYIEERDKGESVNNAIRALHRQIVDCIDAEAGSAKAGVFTAIEIDGNSRVLRIIDMGTTLQEYIREVKADGPVVRMNQPISSNPVLGAKDGDASAPAGFVITEIPFEDGGVIDAIFGSGLAHFGQNFIDNTLRSAMGYFNHVPSRAQEHFRTSGDTGCLTVMVLHEAITLRHDQATRKYFLKNPKVQDGKPGDLIELSMGTSIEGLKARFIEVTTLSPTNEISRWIERCSDPSQLADYFRDPDIDSKDGFGIPDVWRHFFFNSAVALSQRRG